MKSQYDPSVTIESDGSLIRDGEYINYWAIEDIETRYQVRTESIKVESLELYKATVQVPRRGRLTLTKGDAIIVDVHERHFIQMFDLGWRLL